MSILADVKDDSTDGDKVNRYIWGEVPKEDLTGIYGVKQIEKEIELPVEEKYRILKVNDIDELELFPGQQVTLIYGITKYGSPNKGIVYQLKGIRRSDPDLSYKDVDKFADSFDPFID
jgi:hypothetical protein